MMNLKNFLLKVKIICNQYLFFFIFSSFKDWEDGATANKIELAAAFTEDWDDQTIEDDFANQLRAELQKLAK